MTDLRWSCRRHSWIRPSAGMDRGKGRSNRVLAFESTGWPLSIFCQRCLRGAKDLGVYTRRSPDRVLSGSNPGSGVDMMTDGRRRSALDDGGRASGGSRPPVKLAACSLALLAFLSDPAAAFHVCRASNPMNLTLGMSSHVPGWFRRGDAMLDGSPTQTPPSSPSCLQHVYYCHVQGSLWSFIMIVIVVSFPPFQPREMMFSES